MTAFLRDLLGITALTQKVDTMADQASVDALRDQVDSAKTAIDEGVANIRNDIAAIKAANPGVDLTSLESSVGALSTSVAGVIELDEENPAAAPEPTDPTA